jgi:hypothetical protein
MNCDANGINAFKFKKNRKAIEKNWKKLEYGGSIGDIDNTFR